MDKPNYETPITTADFREHIKRICLGPHWTPLPNPLLNRASTRIQSKATDAAEKREAK